MMENSSLPCADDNVTASWIHDNNDSTSFNIFYVRDLALKVIYIVIGIVGVVDNAFVIVIFIFFIKIADKVYTDVRLVLL